MNKKGKRFQILLHERNDSQKKNWNQSVHVRAVLTPFATTMPFAPCPPTLFAPPLVLSAYPQSLFIA
jgi:hypothetical protein